MAHTYGQGQMDQHQRQSFKPPLLN